MVGQKNAPRRRRHHPHPPAQQSIHPTRRSETRGGTFHTKNTPLVSCAEQKTPREKPLSPSSPREDQATPAPFPCNTSSRLRRAQPPSAHAKHYSYGARALIIPRHQARRRAKGERGSVGQPIPPSDVSWVTPNFILSVASLLYFPPAQINTLRARGCHIYMCLFI